MFTFDDEENSKVMLFLSGLRSEKTRDGAKTILDQLLKARAENYSGWVKSSEIFKSLQGMNPRTITRLLKNLEGAKIIIRKECPRMKHHAGKPAVFYCVPSFYNPNLFLSRDELIEKILKSNAKITDLDLKVRAAESIFLEQTGKDIAPLLTEKVRQLKNSVDDAIQTKYGTPPEETDPCEKL